MSEKSYVSQIRSGVHDLVNAALKESDFEMRQQAREAIEDIRSVIQALVNEKEKRLVGSEARLLLDEIAKTLGFSNGSTLMIAFGVRPTEKPDHVPPPPP